MPWRIVFYQEYLGPIVMLTFLYMMGDRKNYITLQKIATLMGVLHFVKRLLETRFVHIFSR